jgi:amino acid adenylation domain-containing protein
MLDDTQRRTILVEWNRTLVDYEFETTIPELVSYRARQSPTAVAAADDLQELTYAELDARSTAFAEVLLELGVTPEAPVIVAHEKSVHVLVGLLGILKAGGVYVPVDPAQPERRIREMIESVGASVAVVSAEFRAALGNMSDVVDPGEAIPARHSGVARHAPAPGNLAYVLFTSGSTGLPKGVAVEHRAVVDLVLGSAQFIDLGPGSAMLQLSPLTFDASTMELWGPLVHGGKVVFSDCGPLLRNFAGAVRRHRVSAVLMIAPQLDVVIERGVEQLAHIRHLLVGGDVVSPSTFRRVEDEFDRNGGELIACYGPTEVTLICSYYRASKGLHRRTGSVPLGSPTPGAQLYILEDASEPVAAGISGDIFVGGPGLARGYVGKPRETAFRFVPHPFSANGERLYRTGDRGRFLDDGSLEFLGRSDSQVKIRGYRVELGEIEAAFSAHDAVRRVVVVPGFEHRARAWGLRAYVVLQRPTDSELEDFVRSRLPEYMVPAEIIAVDELPLTRNHKVDRTALTSTPGKAIGGADDWQVRPRARQIAASIVRHRSFWRRRTDDGESAVFDAEDSTIYKVVINHEEQYSIWRAELTTPGGWREVGQEGMKSECLAYIERVWTDMRPLSLRRQLTALVDEGT